MHLKFNLSMIFDFMYVVLATLYQLNFCYLSIFAIIPSINGTFSLSIYGHGQNFGTQKFFPGKFLYWNREKVKKF